MYNNQESKHCLFMYETYQRYTGKPFDYKVNWDKSLPEDSYRIENHWITTSTRNGLMYAMYAIISKECNLNFAPLEPVMGCVNIYEEGKLYQPRVNRRGNVIEVIDDIPYLKKLVDWMPKNGLNEIFFTFMLWDKVRKSIEEDLVLRNIKVTLGGHSLKYLLNQEHIDVRDFSFANNQRIIERIVEIVRRSPCITRLSLWPEDVGIVEGNGDAFFEDYLKFSQALQEALPDISVEHIVYNAGLNWEMLEPPQISNLIAKNDALFAYWGRDYSQPITSNNKHQIRSNEALAWWIKHQKQANREITIFEYYSDFYMMSEFYGPMSQCIETDINWYLSQNVDGIVNLMVPLIKGRAFDRINVTYNYKMIHMYNNFIYASLLWTDSLESVKDTWFSQYGQDKVIVRQTMDALEKLLPTFTQYNVQLFPNRFVDVEKVECNSTLIEIQEHLKKAVDNIKSKDNDWVEWTKQLIDICDFYMIKRSL